MPTRRTASSRKPSVSLSPILNRIQKINIVYILGILLIVSSFLIGVLITKVSYLEGNNGTATVTGDEITNVGANQDPEAQVEVDEGHLPVLGDKNAKITIVEFSDFECPFCKTLFDESLQQIKKDYVDTGKVKFAYRHYPLTEIHPNAQKSAEASECANEQDSFWAFHDVLFTRQTEWGSQSPADALVKYGEFATEIGIDANQLTECVNSGKFAEAVKKDMADGSAIGVDGTPATFINGYRVSGAVPYSEFKSIIDRELENI